MSGNTFIRPPMWFWIVAAAGLLWFLMDASMFYMRTFNLEKALASMPEAQRSLYTNMPAWVNIVFAAEVIGGLLGCIGLLLRKRWALWLLILSLAGTLCQTAYIWFLSDAIDLMGAPAIVMPLVAIAIICILIAIAKIATDRRWIT